MVEIGIQGTARWDTARAYVDSGASVSIFSAEVADRLGVRLKDGKLSTLTIGDGGSMEIHVHRLNVQLGPYRLLANIGFSEQLGIGFNLLGREDFFKRFDVTFSDSKQHLTFQPVEEKKSAGGKGFLTVVRRRR